MSRALLLAEKPSLMRQIKQCYDKINYKDQIDFVQLAGHVIKLSDPSGYENIWGDKWSWEQLPMIPDVFRIECIEDKKGIVDNVRQALQRNHYDYIINACDPEREGQAIFHYLYDFLGCKLPIKRFWTNDLSDANVEKALRNLRFEGDGLKPDLKLLTVEARLRGQFDWLLGMNGTRASSLRNGVTTRIGRVMTPTLKLVVDRELAIRNYKPSYAYGVTGVFKELEADLLDEEGVTLIEDEKSIIDPILNELKERKEGTVLEVLKKNEKKKAPELYVLSTLQTEANRFFGYTANDTLAIVQSLYEKKIVTYPRTDIDVVSTDMVNEFPTMIRACSCDPKNGDLIKYISQNPDALSRVLKDKKYVDDEQLKNGGHSAIVPTGNMPLWNSLNDAEKNILSLITKRFLCIFLPSQVVQRTSLKISVDDKIFQASGKVILDHGYTAYINKTSHEKELPNLKKGEKIPLIEAKLHTYESTCPTRYTDGTLIQAMLNPAKYLNDKTLKIGLDGEKTDGQSGIGTEATRSGIIEKLVSLKYIERSNGKGKAKQFVPSDFAIKVIQNLDNMDVASIDLTAKWELNLKKVGEGKMSETEFRTLMVDYIHAVIDQFKTNKNMSRLSSPNAKEREVVGKCPLCGNDVVEYNKCYACLNYKKDNGGCGFVVSKEISGAKLSVTNIKKLLSGKETTKLKMTSKRTGKDFESKLRLNNGKLEFSFAETETKEAEKVAACPFCSGSIVLKEGKFGTYYTCSDRCGFTLNTVVGGKKITKTILRQLTEQGETDVFELTKKDKSGTYRAAFALNKETKKMELKFKF